MTSNLKRKRISTSSLSSAHKKHQLLSHDANALNAADEDERIETLENQDGADGSEVEHGSQQDESGGEDEEWTGLGTSSASVLAQGSQKGLPKKPPTGEEVRAIKEATDLFRSSSFKLQIDALLPNIRPKESRRAALDRFLLLLHTCISSAPPLPPQHPLEAMRNLNTSLSKSSTGREKRKDKASGNLPASHTTAVPYIYPPPTEEANWKVAFERPSDITLVGSWPNKVIVKSKDGGPWIVDIAVEMPSGLFQEKDYMNGRFFHKRAFYLAALAQHITSPEGGLNVEASYHSVRSDPRSTTLLLRPTGDEKLERLNTLIRIIPTLPRQSPIPLSKLAPHRSNFRIDNKSSAANSAESNSNLPTPHYNSIILLSTTPREHLLAVHSLKEEFSGYRDALALLRIWANQRGYGEGTAPCVRGFDGRGALWSNVLALLVLGEEPVVATKTNRRPLGKGLSSYQLFRASLDFLARHDFVKNPVFVKSDAGHRFPPEEYAAQSGPVFVDRTSSVNLLAGMPPSSLALMRYDARITLDILNSTDVSGDPFPKVFLKDHRSLATRFDAVVRVNLAGAVMRKPSAHEAVEYGSPSNALLASLATYLDRALGSRVHAFALLHSSPCQRPLTQAQPDLLTEIYIGLVYHPEHAARLVDHGPSASEVETSDVAEFRELWGNKAELRRFKDGSIVESVVWDVKNVDERARIPLMVVEHVLVHHFSLSSEALHSWQAGFDNVVRLPPSIAAIHSSIGHQIGFKAALAAFDELVKTLKGLDEDLPLSILSVSPTSEYLRSTSVFSPTAMPASSVSSFPTCARYTPFIEANLEFEKSGRWPDDLRVIQKMKLAFFERIASALMDTIPGLSARVAIGEAQRDGAIEDHARLELVTPLGWAFALRIWHAREETLLARAIDAVAQIPKQFQKDHAEKVRDRDAALVALALYTRRFIHSPRHHRAVAALGYRYPAYGGTVRLVKRWLASHWLLQTHICEEAVEIICAAVFTRSIAGPESQNSMNGAPGSRERGFSQVVELLKDWQWDQGMFVPLYEEDGAPSSVSVVAGSGGVWTLSTEFDREGKIWTANGPDVVAAQRVRALARATWECLEGAKIGSLDVKSLFVHPTDDYDFVVQLDPTFLPRYFQNIVSDPAVWTQKRKYANTAQDPSNADVIIRPGFDPAQKFVDDMKTVYTDTLKIFYDPLGGDRLGAVWEPTVRQTRPFRVLNHFSSIPVTPSGSEKTRERSMVVVNEAAVLEEIIRMGGGLVRV